MCKSHTDEGCQSGGFLGQHIFTQQISTNFQPKIY